MDRLKRGPGVWEHVVSSPVAMGGELAAAANGVLAAGGRENVLLAVRVVRHENMVPDARRYVVTHPGLWDEALSGPEFYGWSDGGVRDVFEVSRELGLSDVEKRQRVNGRLAGCDLPQWGLPHSVSGFERRASHAVSGIYRMRGCVRSEMSRKVTRTRDLSDSELIWSAVERITGGRRGRVAAKRRILARGEACCSYCERVWVARVSVWSFCHSVYARRPFLCARMMVFKRQRSA